MFTRVRWLMVVCCALLLAPSAALAQATPFRPDLSAASITPEDCARYASEDVDPVAHLGPIACGVLSVPENWRKPAGRYLSIRYVVLKSAAAAPAPDPVVYLAGGPGGSALAGLPYYARLFAPFRAERDVILFDQRGAGYSSPLRCADWTIDDLFALTTDDGPPIGLAAAATPAPDSADVPSDPEALLEVAREQVSDAYGDCARQLLATGVDLRQYNSIANANDTVALVAALDYPTYNLLGISYGTRLALVILRDHPDSGVRSVVLDSTFPPEMQGFERYPAEPHEVVIQLCADCALDRACNAAYPNLKRRFVALLHRLETEPVVGADGMAVGAGDLIQVMQSLSSLPAVAPYVPRMIDELERGQTTTFAAIAGGALPSETAAAVTEATPADAAPATPGALATAFAGDLERLGYGSDTTAGPAQRLLGELQARIAALPPAEADALAMHLLFLGKLPPTRETLRTFVERSFAGEAHAADRRALLDQIDQMSEGDVAELFGVLTGFIDALDPSSLRLNQLMFNSFECNEEIPFERFENTVTTAQRLDIPELGAGVLPSIAQQFATCEVWPSGRAPEIEREPVASDAPTLVMAGAYDMQTPVSWNKTAFVNLANGVFVEFPMSGHGTVTYSDCALGLALAFIDDPTTAPDASCAAALRPQWALPDD